MTKRRTGAMPRAGVAPASGAGECPALSVVQCERLSEVLPTTVKTESCLQLGNGRGAVRPAGARSARGGITMTMTVIAVNVGASAGSRLDLERASSAEVASRASDARGATAWTRCCRPIPSTLVRDSRRASSHGGLAGWMRQNRGRCLKSVTCYAPTRVAGTWCTAILSSGIFAAESAIGCTRTPRRRRRRSTDFSASAGRAATGSPAQTQFRLHLRLETPDLARDLANRNCEGDAHDHGSQALVRGSRVAPPRCAAVPRMAALRNPQPRAAHLAFPPAVRHRPSQWLAPRAGASPATAGAAAAAAASATTDVTGRRGCTLRTREAINTEGAGEISCPEFFAWVTVHNDGNVAHGVRSWAVAKNLASPAPVLAKQGPRCGGSFLRLSSGICGCDRV